VISFKRNTGWLIKGGIMNEQPQSDEGRGRGRRHGHAHTDRIDGIFYGLAFLWGAFVLVAELSGYKADLPCWTTGWGVFFAGAGALAILLTIFRLLLPDYRRRVGQGIVFGCIMLGVGLGDRGVWVWPILLGIIGLTILRGVFLQRRGAS
jgi:hypothetical protein